MPSSADSTVGCISLCMCMMRLQRHIGVVALIGPMSVTAAVDCEPDVLVPADVITVAAAAADDDAEDVLATAQQTNLCFLITYELVT